MRVRGERLVPLSVSVSVSTSMRKIGTTAKGGKAKEVQEGKGWEQIGRKTMKRTGTQRS